jgi:hypothetical protein
MLLRLFILFVLSSSIYANSELESLTVKEIIKKTKPSELSNVAVELSTKGGKSQAYGDYTSALSYYYKSLELRKTLGLDNTIGYATILHLTAISEHKLGNSCKATEQVKKVVQIYQYHGKDLEAVETEKESLKEFKESCKLLSNN